MQILMTSEEWHGVTSGPCSTERSFCRHTRAAAPSLSVSALNDSYVPLKVAAVLEAGRVPYAYITG